MKASRRLRFLRAQKKATPPTSKPASKIEKRETEPAYVVLSILLFFALYIFALGLQGCALGSGESGEESTGGNFLNQVTGLQVGETQTLNFANGTAQLEFDSSSAAQRYMLALTPGLTGGSVAISAGTSGSTAYTIGSAPTNPSPAPATSIDDDAHAWMRSQEALYTGTVAASAPTSSHAGGGYLAATGSSHSFKVLTSLSNPPSSTTITASLIGSGTYADTYLDDGADPLTNQQKSELAAKLDQMAGTLIGAFGSPSDINSDGKLNFVLSPLLANISLTGYFWAGDLNPSDASSNAQEVVFLVAPDTSNYYGGFVSFDNTLRRVLPGVAAHEFQHLLNYNHKQGSLEDPTINEGLSHAVEEWVNYPEELRYKQEACIQGIAQVSLGSGAIDLATRGCAGLFFQHYCEKEADMGACLAQLGTASGTGWQSLAQYMGGDLGRSIGDFLAGLVVTGTNFGAASAAAFDPLSTNEWGDITGFSMFTAYNDFQGSSVDWISSDDGTSLPFSKTYQGFAAFVEIGGGEAITIQLGNMSNVGGTLIRLPDAGLGAVGPNPAP